MAKKKKQEIKKQVKKVSSKISCKCGKEWDRKEVETDSTIHTMEDYRYRFLRTFTTNSSGFWVLEKLNACPDCRKEK